MAACTHATVVLDAAPDEGPTVLADGPSSPSSRAQREVRRCSLDNRAVSGNADLAREKVLLGATTLLSTQLEELQDALFDSAMSDVVARDAIVKAIARRMPSFDPARSSRDGADVQSILEDALANGRSLDYLLELVELYGRGEPATERLKMLVSTTFRRSPLAWDELDGFLALGIDQQLSASQLRTGVRRTWPELPELTAVRDARGAAFLLLDAMDPALGLLRLLRFAVWVAKLVRHLGNVEEAQHVIDWAKGRASGHGISWESVIWTPSYAHAEGALATLLIELDSETPEQDSFAVSAWLRLPGAEYEPLNWAGMDAWFRPTQLSAQLDNLLEIALERMWNQEVDLRLEFWLDYAYLHLEADQWEIGTPIRHPVGAEYVVTVRPRRHPLTAQQRRSWSERWRALKGAAGLVSDVLVFVSRTDAPTSQSLWVPPRSDPGRVLVLSVGSSDSLDLDMHGVLCELLRDGLPAALCIRMPARDAPETLQPLHARLDGRSVHELPDLIRDLRAEAFQTGTDHLGNHLTLVWDDYESTPIHYPALRS